jgi:hypothetical protein
MWQNYICDHIHPTLAQLTLWYYKKANPTRQLTIAKANKLLLSEEKLDASYVTIVPKILNAFESLQGDRVREAEVAMRQGIVAQTDILQKEVSDINIRNLEFRKLIVVFEKNLKKYTIESLNTAFDEAMLEGYINNTFYNLFYYSPSVELRIISNNNTTYKTDKRVKNKRRENDYYKNNNSTYNNNKTKKTYNSSTSTKTYKNNNSTYNNSTNTTPLWERPQRPQHIRANPTTKTLFNTDIKSVYGYCNNHNFWGYCAVYEEDPKKCTWKRQCSKCGDNTHGARTCTKT